MYNKKDTVQNIHIHICTGGVGGWGARRVTHKKVQNCATLKLHKSKSIHARAVKLHTNKDKLLNFSIEDILC